MKRKIVIILTMVLLVSGLSGCNDKIAKTGVEAIKEKGELVIGLDDSFPPMGFVDKTGELVGFDIDLAKAVGEKMGIEIKFQPVEWDGIVLSLLNKDIDLIWNGLTITEERKEKMKFSKAYLANEQIVITNESAKTLKLEDLKDKIVGAQLESSSAYAIDDNELFKTSLKEVKYYPTNTEAFMDLQIGRVDAIVVDEILGKYYIEQSNESFRVLDESIGSEFYGIGMRNEDTSLQEEINKVLKLLKEEGKTKEISTKWFGDDLVLLED